MKNDRPMSDMNYKYLHTTHINAATIVPWLRDDNKIMCYKDQNIRRWHIAKHTLIMYSFRWYTKQLLITDRKQSFTYS